MGPLFVAIVAAEVQVALCLLCLAIALATPSGRRRFGAVLRCFAGGAIGGYLGAMGCFLAWNTVLITEEAGVSLPRTMQFPGPLVAWTFGLLYLMGTAWGGRWGWRYRQPNQSEGAPKDGLMNAGGRVQ